MRESLLQFVWKHGYFNQQDLCLVSGEPVEILYPGKQNLNQGPDFELALIRMGETTLAGNIELHVDTAHWYQHHHDGDPRYQNLILHVVWRHVGIAPGNIPVLELEGRVPHALWKTYALWMNQPVQIPCSGFLSAFPFDAADAWLSSLIRDRLEEKANRWLAYLDELNGHWEALCWHKLSRNFGHHVNADAFETVAKSLSLNLLARHKPQVIQLESLLLGQAGLLNGDYVDPYPKMLRREHQFLARKYGLSVPLLRMEFLRMRPSNFPGLRLAQLAMLLHRHDHLFRHFLDAGSWREVFPLFDVTANDFWHYHYHFHRKSSYCPKKLGASTIRNILVNTVIPLRYAYGKRMGDETLQKSSLRWLEELPPDSDHHTALFRKEGFRIRHASDVQNLHQLKAHYCDHKKCMSCGIGQVLLDGSMVINHGNPSQMGK
jgi:hypothetical protein